VVSPPRARGAAADPEGLTRAWGCAGTGKEGTAGGAEGLALRAGGGGQQELRRRPAGSPHSPSWACPPGLERWPWEIPCIQETRTDPGASRVHQGRFQKGWEGGRKWHVQGRVTPPLALAYTSNCRGQVVAFTPSSRLLRAGICTRMHTCTQSPHTCAPLRAHALTGRTQALHTLGGGEVAHSEDGCPGQAPRPCVQAARAAHHPGRGPGAFCPPAGRWRRSCEHQEGSRIWLLPLSGEAGHQLLRHWGLSLGPWLLGAAGSLLRSAGLFGTPGVSASAHVGGSCLVSGQWWPQPSKGSPSCGGHRGPCQGAGAGPWPGQACWSP